MYLKIAMVMALALNAGLCAAESHLFHPYRIDRPVHVETKMVGPGSDAMGDAGQEWRITNAIQPENNGSLIAFVPQQANKQAVYLDISEIAINVDLGNKIPGRILSDDLLILPGFPIPCDILPVSMCRDDGAEKIYEIRQDIGGQVFVERIRVACRPMDSDDMEIEGSHLRDFFDSTPNRLVQIQAINLRTGALLVRQVWSLENNWWLYEETPHRRSWQKGVNDLNH